MGSGKPPLILASGSPRRKALLGPWATPSGLRSPGWRKRASPPPKALAQALARRKGEAVQGEWVLAADTVVDLDGEVLGKPKDPEENRLFLRRLSGRLHLVHTAFYLRTPKEVVEEVHTARVFFRPLSEEEIAWYVGSGEGLDKAGGYGAQGLGMALLERVEGDFYTVVGLPVSRVFALLWARGFRP